jgi:hypothetical protein
MSLPGGGGATITKIFEKLKGVTLPSPAALRLGSKVVGSEWCMASGKDYKFATAPLMLFTAYADGGRSMNLFKKL